MSDRAVAWMETPNGAWVCGPQDPRELALIDTGWKRRPLSAFDEVCLRPVPLEGEHAGGHGVTLDAREEEHRLAYGDHDVGPTVLEERSQVSRTSDAMIITSCGGRDASRAHPLAFRHLVAPMAVVQELESRETEVPASRYASTIFSTYRPLAHEPLPHRRRQFILTPDLG
ncbi:MAG: hypothetical protein M3461_17065 [Pseudomonadota bacterium]|nr:hypothetical protein [Pseudomonadota bacterium]